MKVLLTGFEPFGGCAINPSEQVVRALGELSSQLMNVELQTLILPVDRDLAPRLVLGAIHSYYPDIVLCLGEAGRRPAISIERVAINLMDYRIADNAGNKEEDRPVIDGGSPAFFSTLPVRILYKALTYEDIPTEISLSAGAFLCNQIMYMVLYEITTNNLPIKAGFIHLPYLPEQASKMLPPPPSMCLGDMIAAVKIMMRPEYYL